MTRIPDSIEQNMHLMGAFDSSTVASLRRQMDADRERIEALDVGYGIEARMSEPVTHPDGSVTTWTMWTARTGPHTTLTD